MASPSSKLSSISVFFPCFNEEKNVTPLTNAFLKLLPTISKKYQIIIINDGSTDATKKTAEKLAKQHRQVKVVNHASNLGYGAALKSGIKHADFDWIFFTDGDGQFDIQQLAQFIPHTQNHQVIIGYRQNRADGQLRALNAKLFKLFIDILYRLHVKDIDCAFKLFKANTIKSLPLKTNGAMISTEILYRLKKNHIQFKQLPVKHLPRMHGTPTGNNLKVILKAGFESISLYLHLKFGSSK